MNPLHWKREHRWALGLAVALGAFVGAVMAYRTATAHLMDYRGWNGFAWGRFLGDHGGTLLGWPLFLAIIAGGIVYIRQLLRP